MRHDDWQRLISVLDGWTSAAAVADSQIEVSLPGGGSRRAIIVMTPDEWDDMVGVMWGSFDDAVDDVKRTLDRLRPEEGFAIYSQYQLKASTTPTRPQERHHAPESGGEWVSLDREGRVSSRFRQWSDSDEGE